MNHQTHSPPQRVRRIQLRFVNFCEVLSRAFSGEGIPPDRFEVSSLRFDLVHERLCPCLALVHACLSVLKVRLSLVYMCLNWISTCLNLTETISSLEIHVV